MTPVRKFPFWTYGDLLILTALVAPCLIVGSLIAQLLGSLSAVLVQAKVWVGMLLFYVLWFGCLYLILKSRYFDEDFGVSLGWVYPRHDRMILCIVTGPVLAIAIGILGAMLRTPMIDLPIKKLLQGQLSLALFGFFSVILGPVTEELAFRGFVMPLFIRTFGREFGILLTAVPFALLHGAQYGWLWQYVVLVGIAGVAFGIARQFTRSTLASAVMHGTYNLTFFVAYVLGGATL